MNSKQLFTSITKKHKIFCFLENYKQNNSWVICCHGLFQDKSESWFFLSKLAQALKEQDISICRYDSRGCGDSTGLMSDVKIQDLFDDIYHIVDFIKNNYKPSNIILVGVGFGCITAYKAAKEKMINSVVLVNPTFNNFFNYHDAFEPDSLSDLKRNGYIDMSENVIKNDYLEKLHNSGSQYWNVLGQRVSFGFFEELNNINLTRLMANNNSIKWFAVLSNKKTESISCCNQIIENDFFGQLAIINAEPIFTHPKAQTDVVSKIKGWILENV